METIYTIGIDIGGTNTVVGVVATNGTILAREKFPTRSCGANFTCFTDKIERYIYALILPARLMELGLVLPMVTMEMVP